MESSFALVNAQGAGVQVTGSINEFTNIKQLDTMHNLTKTNKQSQKQKVFGGSSSNKDKDDSRGTSKQGFSKLQSPNFSSIKPSRNEQDIVEQSSFEANQQSIDLFGPNGRQTGALEPELGDLS